MVNDGICLSQKVFQRENSLWKITVFSRSSPYSQSVKRGKSSWFPFLTRTALGTLSAVLGSETLQRWGQVFPWMGSLDHSMPTSLRFDEPLVPEQKDQRFMGLPRRRCLFFRPYEVMKRWVDFNSVEDFVEFARNIEATKLGGLQIAKS